MTEAEIAKDIALEYVKHLFNEFQDPAMRGPKFTWAGFPKMLRGLVEASLWTGFPYKIGSDIEQYAGEVAYKEAERLVFEAGLHNS